MTVFDGHSFADEGMAGCRTASGYLCPFLNLNERADSGIVSDLASVQVPEVVDLDTVSKLHAGCDIAHNPTITVRL